MIKIPLFLCALVLHLWDRDGSCWLHPGAAARRGPRHNKTVLRVCLELSESPVHFSCRLWPQDNISDSQTASEWPEKKSARLTKNRSPYLYIGPVGRAPKSQQWPTVQDSVLGLTSLLMLLKLMYRNVLENNEKSQWVAFHGTIGTTARP